ncbi:MULTISPECIES: ferritin-like protein [unclassified Moorena]|uniref:ferritin-like domain-containing protein n=1 Tax=unclassified Moorena TaxID=2683338 RepID=UPI0013C74A54|nr:MULTISPECIES: ferritin-like protein [unclassified Moorena]NEO18518.1 hypothetical protein [Moorena sp. SIO4A5]NEQ59046.1 hypothetical protein [Moorena sp. SIO4A1]
MKVDVQPQQLIYKPITTKAELRASLQAALYLEFATIPPYLTAVYSMKDKSAEAYQIIRSVALEEMLHINLVCNLLLAIGYSPLFVKPASDPFEDKVPYISELKYPNYILPKFYDGPYVQILAASPELIKQTFMAIEEPMQFNQPLPAAGERFTSIGQIYQAIKEGFKTLAPDVFTGTPDHQKTNYYFGSGGGKAIKVTNLDTAEQAIEQIVQQGEGATPPTTQYRPKQPYGTYNRYGHRNDGTYGPILGTPFELSHYFKFRAIADGKIPLPSTYPMLPNPSIEKFSEEYAKKLASQFQDNYSLMIQALEQAFADNADTTAYFTTVVELMQSVFPPVITQLMKTPISADTNSTLGPTAGPCFEYKAGASCMSMITKVSEFKQKCLQQDEVSRSMVDTWQKVEEALQKISKKIEGTPLEKHL